MVCKACKNEVPAGSVYCMYCGERLIREKSKKQEIKVPKPVQLPSGSWRIQLKAEGQSVTEATAELCITKAKAIRAGFLEQKAKTPKLTLDSAIQKYIDSKDSILSPSTIRGYDSVRRKRFQNYSERDISSINWQNAVNEESKLCAPKTLKNAWRLVSSVLRSNGLQVPDVSLPSQQPKSLSWLNLGQIQAFLNEVRGTEVETAALLALHSLRLSELLAITPARVDDAGIHVVASRVLDRNGNLVEKLVNKNPTSTRVVPFLIPRLQEILHVADIPRDQAYVTLTRNKIYNDINSACKRAEIPAVGVHGLRRSFASLAYHVGWPERVTMQIGGWADFRVMHQIYIKLDSSDVEKAVEKMRSIYEEFPTQFPSE